MKEAGTVAERRIAAQTYTVRECMQTPSDIGASLRRIRAIGYEAVQLSGHGPMAARELKAILDGEGLIACATHRPFSEFRDDPAGVVAFHQSIGCRHACIPIMPEAYRSEEGYRRFAREADALAGKLAREGITLSYHNHAFELERYGERTGLDILIEETEELAFEIDTYWIQFGGGDPAAWIAKVSGRSPLVHLKDMAIKDGEQVMAEVGEGNLEWRSILAACAAAGVDWYIVEQDTCAGDPFDSLQISLANLTRMDRVDSLSS